METPIILFVLTLVLVPICLKAEFKKSCGEGRVISSDPTLRHTCVPIEVEQQFQAQQDGVFQTPSPPTQTQAQPDPQPQPSELPPTIPVNPRPTGIHDYRSALVQCGQQFDACRGSTDDYTCSMQLHRCLRDHL